MITVSSFNANKIGSLNRLFGVGKDMNKNSIRGIKMGKIFKLSMVIISAVVLLGIVYVVITSISNMENNTGTQQQSSSHLPGKSEYNKIRVGDEKTGRGGMTLKEVEKILGKSTSQSEGHSGKLNMDVYTFATKAGPNSILVSFINGHVSGKTQTGLE